MPYISDNNRRKSLQNNDIAQTAGELNYQIFYLLKYNPTLPNMERKKIISKFIKRFLGTNPTYQKYNDMTGCLVRCAVELKRRLDFNADFLIDILEEYDQEIAEYEDKKLLENGEV